MILSPTEDNMIAMAVANLLKHKIRFKFDSDENDMYEPTVFNLGRHYLSNEIENLESIDVSDANELRLKCLDPFIVYIISTLVHEEYYNIDSISVLVELIPRSGTGYDIYDFIGYNLDNPRSNIHLFPSSTGRVTYSFPERMLNSPFSIYVRFNSYYLSDEEREETFLMEHNISHEQRDRILYGLSNSIDVLEPPIETYRQEKCIICLESKPNILYLDCMHIAICDSCDRMKSETSLRLTCDVCRAEISRRIKI